jgi:uncharacterized protein (TIGR00159 family)
MRDVFYQILTVSGKYWTSGLEILILSTILYYIYLYLRGTHGARILIGLALVFLTLTFISQVLDLAVLGWLLRSFSVFMAIALVVLFQPELRRALNELGSHRFFTTALQRREAIEEITDTVFDLSSKGFGALIALERDLSLKSVAESGVDIDAEFSKELLLTIFHPKTVLHDGGVILSGDRIVAADRPSTQGRSGALGRKRHHRPGGFGGERTSFDLSLGGHRAQLECRAVPEASFTTSAPRRKSCEGS